MKKWKVIFLLFNILTLLGITGCSSGGDPYVTMDEAREILSDKKYDIVETDSFMLLDGTLAAGKFLIATKGDNFTLIFSLDDMEQEDAVKEVIRAEYQYNYYIIHEGYFYVMNKQAAKDLGIQRYINLIK